MVLSWWQECNTKTIEIGVFKEAAAQKSTAVTQIMFLRGDVHAVSLSRRFTEVKLGGNAAADFVALSFRSWLVPGATEADVDLHSVSAVPFTKAAGKQLATA